MACFDPLTRRQALSAWPARLATAALWLAALPAQAVDTAISVFASAELQRPGQAAQFSGQVWQWQTGPLFAQPWASSRAVGSELGASAIQGINGWFEVQAEADHGWQAAAGRHAALATTEMQIAVSTTEPDTPLLLDFVVQGSRLRAASYYGGGRMEAATSLRVQTSFDGLIWQTHWGLQDTIRIDSGATAPVQHLMQFDDPQGLGQPVRLGEAWGWQDMQIRGELQRGLFMGQLDLGLLQPGALLLIRYAATASVEADPRYAGTAFAWLEDPFALREAPPLLRLQGLSLPVLALSPVPEPGSAGLLAAGLLVLVTWRRPRARRQAGPLRSGAALLAACAALAPGPARAELVLDTLEITARSSFTDVALGRNRQDVRQWRLAQGQPVIVGSQLRPLGAGTSAQLLATQSPDGFSQVRITHTGGWDHNPIQWHMDTSTEYVASLHTTTPDTPLRLGFHFFGSEVALGAHYGAGQWLLQAGEVIAGGRVGPGQPGVQALWSVSDRVTLASGVPSLQAGGLDAQSIGTPLAERSERWVQFERQLGLRRGAFRGVLDFGLLQPGETFELRYSSSARIELATAFYPGHALAFVVDPFSFAQPPAQLAIDGLDLPKPVSSVPEPGTWLLWLGGLLAVALAQRGRGRPRRRPAAATAQPSGPAPALALAGAGPAAVQFAPAAANAEVTAFRFDGHDTSATDHFQPRRAAVSPGGVGTLGNGAGEGSFLGTAVANLARGSLHISSVLQTTGNSFAQVLASASLDDLLFFDNTQPVTVTAGLAQRRRGRTGAARPPVSRWRAAPAARCR